MESVTLNTGATMPALGFGTSPSEVGLSAKSVVAAVKAGFRHIDCARCYGNEKEIGFGLKKLFEEGVVKREDLFITSKLWCNDQAPEDVPKALKSSLDDLQIDHLDLYLIHWPFCVKKGSVWTPENIKPTDMASTWSAMEKLYHCGKTHAIGVSNFSSKKLEELFPVALVPPAVNQVECHPGWQQRKLQSFCNDKGIHLSGYAPLGSHGSHWGNKTDILKNPIVTSVAEESGKTPAQVCLRWGLQMGHSVIVKSVTEARIIENFDIFNWFLPDHLVAMFSEIGQKRLLMGDFLLKPHEQLWDEESN